MKTIVFHILFYSGVGTLLSFRYVQPERTGPRFFLYHSTGALVMMGLAQLFLVPQSFSLWCLVAYALGVAHCLLIGKNPRLSIAALRGCVLIFLFVIFYEVKEVAGVSALLSTSVLGFGLGAMCLGHWYLIEPKLPIDELKRLTLLLLIFLSIRTVGGLYGLYTIVSSRTEAEIYTYLFSTTPGLFFVMRLAWGLAGSLFLTVLVWKTVQIRSTQSATGILYVVVLSILTGEILNQYLTATHNFPW